jgi:carnitine O-acetyltransferase
MLGFQQELERLPVPALSETCALYLQFVRPLVTDVEFAETARVVSEFVLAGGRGETLQRRLRRWSEIVENWLEPFWDDHYLCDDSPLVVNVSPGFALPGTNRPQIARAAGLLAAAVRFKQLVDREQLEPDLENGAPRCMWEYTRVCASTRIPGATRDVLRQYPASRHVVVVRGAHFSSLDVLDEAGRAYGVEDLERALQRIVDDVGTPGPPVGVLTTGGRRAWARVRDEHLRGGSGPARELLAAVETAILVLVLESGRAPAHPCSSEAARLFLHGDARRRWFDKSIQLIVAANGVSGFCMEHAGFDGSTALRLAEFLVENEGLRSTEATARNGHRLAPKRLPLERTDALSAVIERSERGVAALLGRTDLALLDFSGFGKREIVRHELSPDGFVQMAFQLTHYTLTGETASTYESISTKRFLHGRTEAMRCVSSESVAFVRSLRDASGDTAAAEERLRAAVARHVATVQRCKEGRGVDRHLLGLSRMLEPDEPVPALFADPAYATLSRSVLSTSSLRSSPGVELTCFGPVVEEGFGLSYTVHDDSILVVVTNFHGLASAFAGELERSLLEMRALLVR